MAPTENKGGRPPRYVGERLSQTRSFRVRGQIDAQLQEAAAKAGRSVSEEIEHRLERTFQDDHQSRDLMGSHVAGEILRLVRGALFLEGLGLGGDWAENRVRAQRVRVAVDAVVAVVTGLALDDQPSLRDRAEGLSTAKALLLRSSVNRELPSEIMFSEIDLEPPFPEPKGE
jgi:hypothetical protein